VTVVIPTRNRRALLAEAVDSALQQHGVTVDVVVIDDASSDGTEDWLRQHPDPRLRSVRFDPPRERTAARNAGLALATAPYVMFLDDDDLIAADGLARLADALDRHAAAPVAAGTYATFGTHGPLETPRQQPNGWFVHRRRMFREILWGWYLLPGAGLWRAEELRRIGGWDESRNFAEDMELSLRIHPRPMVLVPHVTLRYRQHGRPIDRARERREEAMNNEVRSRFIERLSPRDRRAAQRVVDARPAFADALVAYDVGRYRVAARGLVAGMRAAPALCVSPVLGPTLWSMLAKSIGALVVPEAVRDRIRRARRAGRARRHDTGA
jgi:glycosyltransferase involved in cell wall biosynthesis